MSPNHYVHTNVAIKALCVRYADKCEQWHDLFDPVNVARQWAVKQIAASYANNCQRHQRERRQTADLGKLGLNFEQSAIEFARSA